MDLKENIIKYKNITLNIIETVKEGEYEKLDEKFHQRQLILDDINKTSFSKEQLEKTILKYDIKNIEKKLLLEMKVKKSELLKIIKKNKNKQLGMAGYNNISVKAVFLSKEV